jgi:hypothetical protein
MDGLGDGCKDPVQLAAGCIISLALREGHAGAGPSSPHNSPVSHCCNCARAMQALFFLGSIYWCVVVDRNPRQISRIRRVILPLNARM